MLYAHNIHINVFTKPEDDEEKIKKTLLELVSFDLEKEKIDFKIETVDISEDRKMKIFEVILKKQRHANGFTEHIFSNLGKEQVELLKIQIDSRVDENASFFLRLDKDELMFNRKYVLTDTGNCFHIRMSIAAFPSNKDKAIIVANQMIDSFLAI